jgi:hypothetical protein
VEFLSPHPGSTLTDTVLFRIGAGATDQIVKWEFGTQGGELETQRHPMGHFHLNTRQLPNGPRTYVARATYRSGVVRTAKLSVTVYNPSHRLTYVNLVTYHPIDGRDAIVELGYNEPGLRLEVDLSELDSHFDPKKVRVSEIQPGVYRVVYRISRTSTAQPGRHKAYVRAGNPAGEIVRDTFDWQLRKHPLMPLKVQDCKFSTEQKPAFFSSDTNYSQPHVRIAPKAVGGVPREIRLSAPPSLKLGQLTSLRVSWTSPEPHHRKPLSDRTRIFVVADGHSGYGMCWVPPGETEAQLTLNMKPPGVHSNIPWGDPIPKEVRLLVAVERAGFASRWVPLHLRVEISGHRSPRASKSLSPLKSPQR